MQVIDVIIVIRDKKITADFICKLFLCNSIYIFVIFRNADNNASLKVFRKVCKVAPIIFMQYNYVFMFLCLSSTHNSGNICNYLI